MQVDVIFEQRQDAAGLDVTHDRFRGMEHHVVRDKMGAFHQLECRLPHFQEQLFRGRRIMALRPFLPDPLGRDPRFVDRPGIGVEVDHVTVEDRIAFPVQADHIAVHLVLLSEADIFDDLFDRLAGEVAEAEEFPEAVAFRTGGRARQMPQEWIVRKERIEIIRSDLGLDLERGFFRRDGRAGQNILVILRHGSEGTQHEPFAARREFIGEDPHDARDHLIGGITFLAAVVDDRIFRLGQRQDHAVQVGEHFERLFQLVADQAAERFAEQIEFAVGIQQTGQFFGEPFREHDFPMPEQHRTLDRMRGGEDRTEFRAVVHDFRPVHIRARLRIILVKQETVQSAGQLVAWSANLKTVHPVTGRIGDDLFHVIGIKIGRMHQRPGDFGSFHRSYLVFPLVFSNNSASGPEIKTAFPDFQKKTQLQRVIPNRNRANAGSPALFPAFPREGAHSCGTSGRADAPAAA